MTEPEAAPRPPVSLADVAAEPPEESVERERILVEAEQPDSGGLVPPDRAQ
jgi:hypothetical protein